MLLIDIDHFKAFNDTYGHQAGDACLLVVADLLAEHTRLGTDIAARFGGEEFAVLMPGASLSRAVAVGERLREAVESLSVPLDGASCSVRISVGCASLVADSQSPPACLITAADEALYCAKRTGRNRTHPAAFVE
jgi:diguanylate cyclase (GGDEF)-like protein